MVPEVPTTLGDLAAASAEAFTSLDARISELEQEADEADAVALSPPSPPLPVL